MLMVMGPLVPTFHEVSISPFSNARSLNFPLQIRMLVRLMPIHGGDGTVHRITVINDTGSNILTLFTTDLQQLGNIQGYNGWRRSTRTTDANGTVTVYRTILVQVQLLRDDNTTWGNWITERAIVKQPSPGVPRLSGVGIRRALYIGTGPGNHLLSVSATKGGSASLLPLGSEEVLIVISKLRQSVSFTSPR
jgi:hypothetical protein